MPLQDGSNPIGRMVITDSAGTPTEIDVARIGTTPVFPDNIGAPLLTGFSISGNTIPASGGSVTFTVTGDEEAQWSISVNSGSVSPSSGTIDSSGSATVTWTFGSNSTGANIDATATLSAVGITVLEEGLDVDHTVSQVSLIIPTCSVSNSSGSSTSVGNDVTFTRTAYNGNATTFTASWGASGVTSPRYRFDVPGDPVGGISSPGIDRTSVPNIPIGQTSTFSAGVFDGDVQPGGGTFTGSFSYPETDTHAAVSCSASITLFA